VPRIASAILVAGLLVATAAAFAVTERLKLVRSPVIRTHLDRGLFSPVCGCETSGVEIGFRLRKPDRITLRVVDSSGAAVRTLIDRRRYPAGAVAARWDGRDDAGGVVPEGTYRPRVHLADQRRTIVLPNPMRVDTTPPKVLGIAVDPRRFSPDGDGRRDKTAVHYRLSEKASVRLLVDSTARVTGRGRRAQGKIEWHGTVDGRSLPAGRYDLSLVATDKAGNDSAPSAPSAVRIRYIELARDDIHVRARRRFSVRVRTDAQSFTWRLGRRLGGVARPGPLVIRAPQRTGRYALVVEANGHRDRAEVRVERRRVG
jgi:flagellar hook capping protein FlgD